jgi:hypothetical protein
MNLSRISSILYAFNIIYVIVCIVLWGLLLYAASGDRSYGGYAIMAMIFVPFWPIGLPFALYGFASMGASLVRNAISKVQRSMVPVQPVAPVQPVTSTSAQPVVDAAKTKEAADAAVREKTVAVVTDAKAAAAAPVVDMTAVAK